MSEKKAKTETDSYPSTTNSYLEEGTPRESPEKKPHEAPDGGTRAWLAILGAFLAAFVQFGLANAYGVFQRYYADTLLTSYRPDAISWIGAVQEFVLFGGGLITGPLFDSLGATALLIPGGMLFVLSLLMTALCTKYYQLFLAQGVLFGLASALIFHPVVSTPGQWFSRRRALATAIAIAGSGLGGTLWPIILQHLLRSLGFRNALLVTAGISAALLAPASLLMRSRLPRRKLAAPSKIFTPFRKPAFAFLAIGSALNTWGLFTPFFYLSVRAGTLGASTSLAFATLSILNAASTLGRLAAALGDKFGRLNVLLIAQLLCSIFLLALWTPLSSVSALLAFSVLYGAVCGVVIALIPAAIGQLAPPDEAGAWIGVTYALLSLFVLSGPPINGALLGSGFGFSAYGYSGLFSGCASLAGTVLIGVGRLCVDRRVRAVV